MKESLESSNFKLHEGEVQKLIELNKNIRKVDPTQDEVLFRNTPLFD